VYLAGCCWFGRRVWERAGRLLLLAKGGAPVGGVGECRLVFGAEV
jgi:hypothetical protein